MKTYSRKNSSYLKKAFIASNFNEMCRLCLSELDLGLTPIFQEFSKISYQEWIQYSVDVLIEEGDGLPTNICEECLVLVEQTYLFKKKCKASDSKLREHLELLEHNEDKLNETGLIDLSEDHRNLFKIEEPSVSKCDESSSVDSGGTKIEVKEENSVGVRETKEILKEESKVNSEIQSLFAVTEYEYPEPQENVQVKRYILKGKKGADDQEEDLTVCEVVPLEAQNEKSVMSDQSETPTYTMLVNANQNGLESETDNLQEVKIQEIYQLWDNEEEGEGQQEVKENEEGIMILDVSWDNNKKPDFVEKEEEQNRVFEKPYGDSERNDSKILKKKLKTISKVDKIDIKCFVCGKDFQTGVQLKEHLTKFHHEVSDAAFCEVCGNSFVCSTNLKRHMNIHTGYKPHKCKICGRMFSQGSILKRHVFTHEVSKPYNCQICGKGYTQKMNLLSHFKSHGFRTEGETFSCQHCDKKFVHQSGLSRHLKSHKGVRFSCKHCEKSYVDSSALTRHVKTIHPNKI